MPYLSIDIGSSAVKAALISENGRLIGLARRPAPLHHGEGGAHEADPEDWVEGAASASRELAAASPGTEIRAISVSGNGPTLLAADAQGRPLGRALSWMDRRAVQEAAEVSNLAELPIDSSFYLPKALRLWRSSPELRKRLRWFFSCPEYLLFMLSGEALTYLPHPGYAPYVWDSSLLASLSLPAERFPPFATPGRLAGSLLPEPAQRFGLKQGIPLVTGFPDFLASIVGSAVVEPGLACDRGGTSEAINICTRRPYPGRELLSLPHAVPGLWNISGGLSTAGGALEWLAGVGGYSGFTSASSEEGAITAPDLEPTGGFLAEARLSPPGARGLVFLPYLAGERAPLWDSERRGAFVGLSLDHGRPDLARAALESIPYGLRLATELAEAAGFPLRLVRTSGAPAKDDFLCALKADVLDLPVEAPEIADCELVGDACACACALGEAGSLAEAATSLVRIARRFEPEAGNRDRYTELFGVFKAAIAALGPVDSLLSRYRRGQR